MSMDPPDNTEVNLNISLDSDYFLDKNPNQSDENDFFLTELFRAHCNKEQENKTNEANDTEKENGNKSDQTDSVTPSTESSEMDSEKILEPVATVQMLIEKLKSDNIKYKNIAKEAKDALYLCQCQLAEYEVKLSQSMNTSMTLQIKIDSMTESFQLCQNDRASLTTKVEELQAELKQFKNLVKKQMSTEDENGSLKKELAEVKKAMEKNKKQCLIHVAAMNTKHKELMDYKKEYKRVMAQLLECCEMLISYNLLSGKKLKKIEYFMESFRTRNLDNISESSNSMQDRNDMTENQFNHTAMNNNLPNGNCIKREISSDEELTNSNLSSSHSNNGYSPSPSIESSANIKASPLMNSDNIECNISKDKFCPFQVPFSPISCKVEDSSDENRKNSKIGLNNITVIPVNSNLSHHGALKPNLTSIDEVEIVDECINLKEIMGNMVMKVEDLDLISPIPESPFSKLPLHSDKIKIKNNIIHSQASNENSNTTQKGSPTSKSNDCKKSRLSHQTSEGFETHFEETSGDANSPTSPADSTIRNSHAPISSNLHYVSSAYANNAFKIVHQGSSAIDYIANSDTKLSALVLTIPKSTINSTLNNENDIVLPSVEERKNSVQSLYDAAMKSETSVIKELLNSSENKTENSENEPFSYICVQIDSKNGQINLRSNLENNSVSNKLTNPCLTTQGHSSKIIHEKNNVPKNVEQENNPNLPFMPNTCDISPRKRKLTKTLCQHDTNQNKLNMRENKNQLPVIIKTEGNSIKSNTISQSTENKENKNKLHKEMNKSEYSSSGNHPPESNEILNVESAMEFEKADVNLKRHFSTFDDNLNTLKNPCVEVANNAYENSKNEATSLYHASNFKKVTVQSETPFIELESDETFNKIITSTPHNISSCKNNSEKEMDLAVTSDNNLESNFSHVKQELFQDVDCKSPTTDISDNLSQPGMEEIEETVMIHPNLKRKSPITSTPDKKINESLAEHKNKFHNFTDFSTLDVFSADTESPASKKRKLSLKSPLKIPTEDKSDKTLNDVDPNSVRTIAESPLTVLKNSQSSVHLINHTSVNNCYGVFKNSSDCMDEEDTIQTDFKSLDVSPHKNADDFDDICESNLSNVLPKKKKKKNKKKNSHDSSSSLGIRPKKCRKSRHSGNSQSSTSFLSGVQDNLEIPSPNKQLIQNDLESISDKILKDNKIKFDSKSLGSIQTDSADVKINTEMNSAKVDDKNVCNIPLLENEKFKTSEDVTPDYHESSTIQAIAHTNNNFVEGKTLVTNIDQEQLSDNDNLPTEEISDDQLKFIEKDKINSSNNLLSGNFLNNKEQCNTLFSSNITIPESVEMKKDLILGEDDSKMISCPHEPSVNVIESPDKNVSLQETPIPEIFEKSSISRVEKESPFENKIVDDLDDSQNEDHEHISYQSNISDDENPLVIAEDEDDNQIAETGSNVENEKEETSVVSENSIAVSKNETDLSPEIKKTLKSKRKKRKASKTSNANKRSKSQSSCEEEAVCNTYTIEKALDDIKIMKFEAMLTNHSKYKLLQHKLISALINPANAPNTTSALYQIFNFLSSSKLNPLISYPVQQNISVFYPPAENCIVEALIKTESKKKIHLEGLISSAIATLYYLILDKKTISKTGLGALCRVFTQLCKLTNNKQKPIKLTCDLIKEQHPLAPVLIAFIIGTWVELFDPSKDKDVFRVLLLSSIFFGLQKKPSTVTSADWTACKAVFKLTSAVPLPVDLKATTDIIITSMEDIVKDPPSEKDEWASDQMLIFAVTKGWIWTQENIVNFAIESLHHYAKNMNNERAFSFFAELCADIGKLAPHDSLTILEALTTLFMEDCEFDYVKKHAARSLLKLLLFKHLPIHEVLTQYFHENANYVNDSNIELYLRRRCIADEVQLTENDILIA